MFSVCVTKLEEVYVCAANHSLSFLQKKKKKKKNPFLALHLEIDFEFSLSKKPLLRQQRRLFNSWYSFFSYEHIIS